MDPRTKNILIAAAVTVLALALLAGAVYFNRPKPVRPVDSASMREAITAEALMGHLHELQTIAEANGGNRKAGTPGHAASVDYVDTKLKEAGYKTERQQFFYASGAQRLVSFERVGASGPRQPRVGSDVDVMGAFMPAEVTADVTPVDLNLDGDRQTTSGCEASDFEGFPVGNIALVQRGTCRFDVKADLATQAGASAVIVMNQGDTADRRGIFMGELSDIPPVPVLAATFELGAALAAEPSRVALIVDSPGATITENLIAELPGRGDRTAVVGAHLDGVESGPGINDNGSGVAVALELALQLAEQDAQLARGVRFAFWSGEEDGLHGSRHYVEQLDDAGRRAIEVYLNLDMVGSPNPVPGRCQAC